MFRAGGVEERPYRRAIWRHEGDVHFAIRPAGRQWPEPERRLGRHAVADDLALLTGEIHDATAPECRQDRVIERRGRSHIRALNREEVEHAGGRTARYAPEA